MAFAHVWGAAEDNQPDGTKPIGQGDDYIVQTRQMTRERISLEHNFDFTVDGEQGSHRMGSARVWVSETQPTSPIPGTTPETPGQLANGRFWFKPSTGEAFVYDLSSSSWKAINITGAQLLAMLVAFAEKTSIGTADKVLIIDVSGGNIAKYVTFATLQATIAATVYANRPWNDTAALIQAPGTQSAGSANYIARADHVHPKGDAITLNGNTAGNGAGQIAVNNGTVNTNLNADLLDGQHASYFQPASSAITTSNIGAQSVSYATSAGSATNATNATNTENADKVDGLHAGNASGQVPVSNGTVNTNLNADMVDGLHAATTNTASTVVARDASGNFSAGTITANLAGNADSATIASNLVGLHSDWFTLFANTWKYYPGTREIFRTAGGTTSTYWVTVGEWVANRDGTVTAQYALAAQPGTAYGRILHNGVVVPGSEITVTSTNYSGVSVDITCAFGDKIQFSFSAAASSTASVGGAIIKIGNLL